jgi:hypothetical protein
MTEDIDTSKRPRQPSRQRGLWLWFLVGFVIVFVGMSFFVTMHAMHPSGGFAVIRCSLWQYYAIEIPRTFSLAPRNLGPATGSSSVVETALMHLIFSVVGGVAMLGIGLFVRKMKGNS